MNWQPIFDILFRLGLYRGTAIESPANLITCTLDRVGQFGRRYRTTLNDDHELSEWLINVCDGPWAIRMKRPYYERKTLIAFARAADALIFRILSGQF